MGHILIVVLMVVLWYLFIPHLSPYLNFLSSHSSTPPVVVMKLFDASATLENSTIDNILAIMLISIQEGDLMLHELWFSISSNRMNWNHVNHKLGSGK